MRKNDSPLREEKPKIQEESPCPPKFSAAKAVPQMEEKLFVYHTFALSLIVKG